MKRKILTALVIAAGLSLTACQEDPAMDELIQDTELQALNNGEEDDKTTPPPPPPPPANNNGVAN